MLTDFQIQELAPKMGIDLKFIGFKSNLPKRLHPNKAYIINLDSEKDLDGSDNSGTHWVALYVKEYANGKKESIYFDPYGVSAPEIVKRRVKQSFDIGLPYTTKDIQSLMANVCGYYCMAFLHFISHSPYRSGNLYQDVETFLDMFDDLNEKYDYKKNEYILKHFFLSEDPNKRKPVELDGIIEQSNSSSNNL